VREKKKKYECFGLILLEGYKYKCYILNFYNILLFTYKA